jgi:hypothetical protein
MRCYEIAEGPPGNHGEVRYFIHIDKKGREKIKRLENISVGRGQRFCIAVNCGPVYGACFWNPVSSFNCGWIVISDWESERLEIKEGYPKSHFASEHSDPRDSTGSFVVTIDVGFLI